MTEPATPEPSGKQGRCLKMPYDWREPDAGRAQARMWNPGDHRLFTPKAFGWGYTINFYWLAHPLRYFQARS